MNSWEIWQISYNILNLIKGNICEQKLHMESNSQSQEMGNSSSSTSSSVTKTSSSQEIPPRSPTPAFRAQLNRSAKTEAHPNALKNIKNYPLLLASLTEAAHHLEESNSNLFRRSISHIDFRNLDLDKISKLFGLEENWTQLMLSVWFGECIYIVFPAPRIFSYLCQEIVTER